MVADRGEGEDLVHAGKHRELLGLDPLETRPVEQVGQVVANDTPGVLEPLLRVDLLGEEAPSHLGRRIAERETERIRQ